MLSFLLMFVIMAVATDTRAVGEAAAIAIGGTIGLAPAAAESPPSTGRVRDDSSEIAASPSRSSRSR
jgi:glycerol uptake facilitator-like aquaporin